MPGRARHDGLGRLKDRRRVAMRFDRDSKTFTAAIAIAATG
jgi:hypothetical protein